MIVPLFFLCRLEEFFYVYEMSLKHSYFFLSVLLVFRKNCSLGSSRYGTGNKGGMNRGREEEAQLIKRKEVLLQC